MYEKNQYWFSLMFSDNGNNLKNHRRFDRFEAFEVEKCPERHSSDYDVYGENTTIDKISSATTDSNFEMYSMTIGLESGKLLRVQRGDKTWNMSLAIGNSSDSYYIHVGAGGGHEIEVEYIRLEQLG